MHCSKIDTIKIGSEAFGKTLIVKVYVPDCDTYGLPVLYLMHGRSGNESIIYTLNIQSLADKLIETGRIQPMLIVCPQIEDTMGLNVYEDYFFSEAMPLIGQRYHTRTRYIGGFSEGGYVALNYALRHPKQFSRVGAHMLSIYEKLTDKDMHFLYTYDYQTNNNPISLARRCPVVPETEFYLDMCNDDRNVNRGFEMLAEILEDRGAHVQSHNNAWHHESHYIKDNLENYLEFYSGGK